MKKLSIIAIIALIALTVPGSILLGKESTYNPSTIQLPSKAILQKRLNENGFDYFEEKMELSDKFANAQLYPLGVRIRLECVLYDFCKENPGPVCTMAHMTKDNILKVLLQDNPQAIDEIKELLDQHKN